MMPRLRFALVAGTILAGSAFVSPVLGDVINSDFETMVDTIGSLPNDYGYWRGDGSEITGATEEISPFEGQRMLRFRHTTADGPGSSIGSEIWQIIDVSDSLELIRSGEATANLSAWFNRIGELNDELIDTMFSVSIAAYAGEVESFPDQWQQDELAEATAFLFSDDNQADWEISEVGIEIPELTDFIVIRLNATEDMFNDVEGDEFHGHFVDAVTFNLVPAPPVLISLVPVFFMSTRRRRR